MINLPSSFNKGESLAFSLNKSLVLAAISDSYWSDSANISKCFVIYESTSGHQRKRLEFDFTQETPITSAEWSLKARDDFEIKEIVLIDFDNDSFTISKSSLPSGKGISFGTIVNIVLHNYVVSGGSINDIISDGNSIYIGGSFTTLSYTQYLNGTQNATGSYSRKGVAKLTKDSNGNWKVDETFDTSNGATGIVWTLLKDGNWLYVAGDITAYAGQTRNRIARIDATTGALDSFFGVGLFTSGQTTGQFNGLLGSAPIAGTGVVNRLAKTGDSLYIVGAFTQYSKKNSSGAAAAISISTRWIVVNVLTNTETVPSNGANNHIYEVLVDGSSVYFGGAFTSWGGVSRNYLVKTNNSTFAADSGFTSPISSGAFVDMMALVNGEIWAGVQASNSLLRINKTSGSLLNSYAISVSAGNTIRVRGGIFEDSTYVYVLMSRINTAYIQEIRRISKSTGVLDASWGYETTANNNVWMSAVMVGDEFIIGGFPNSTTTSTNLTYKKELWSVSKITAAEQFNI